MSDIIHLLPDHIANQIAAGEVIQRPASVLKELLENAIDAGATRIQVQVKDAGRTLIQVIDDGKGMSETDARMAFERHATSKISTADDLFALQTMGFRGEALASIVAVAQVDLRTRQKGAELGSHLRFSGSELECIEPDSCAEGSIFSIKNLFYNVPARRKFLKSNETEFHYIISEFERVALVNPEVAMSLYHNEAEFLNLPASTMRQRIIHVYGKSLHQKLIPVEIKSSLVHIGGFVGTPDSSKKRGALQFLFVNGRFMKHPYFHKAIMQAYDQLIPVGEQPGYFLYFTVDPSSIDVNIHPTKTEIKFENEQSIWQILSSVVREALAKSSAIPAIDFEPQDTIRIPVYLPDNVSHPHPSPAVRVDTSYDPFKSDVRKPSFEWSRLYADFEKETMTDTKSDGSSIPLKPVVPEEHKETWDETELFETEKMPCYQYKGRYIVTSLKSGLTLIDQHRAHVRILYDRYLGQLLHQQATTQQVLFPEIITFTPAEMAFLPSLQKDLLSLGFDLSDLGNGSYAINGLPAEVTALHPVHLLKDMISRVLDTGARVEEEMERALALSLAELAAIPAGKRLSPEEMEDLLASLFSCPDSNLTPDGKTIVSILTEDELRRRFY